jgi:NAD(P)-dependent dehydrogenase (short-subunit alcohol dehydrogenase family)
MNLLNLEQKVAVVTGGATGIGAATAQMLRGAGAEVVVFDLDGTIRVDVTSEPEVSAALAQVADQWGGVDILVNNAGITYYGGTDQMSAEHWDKLVRVNLLSHIQFTRELLPSLLERPEAHVLNVCSMFGLVGMPKLAAYSTTKFGMVGFTEVLRAEYGRDGLGVTALCPGFVDTNLFAAAPLGELQKAPKIPPAIFCTSPEKVARAAVKAIRRNRRMVVMTPAARFLVSLKRFLPAAIDFVFRLGQRKRIERKMAQLKRAA